MPNQAIYNKLRDFFDGLLSADEEAEVKKWLLNPSDKAAKNEALHQIWNQSIDNDDPYLESAVSRYMSSIDAYETRRRRRHAALRVLKWAAVFMLPVLSALVAWYFTADSLNSSREMASLYVPEDHIDSLVLSDGSKVYVNGGTTLYYPKHFSRMVSSRDVYLSGEANFNVSHDSRHPFIVHAGKLSIQVLGTRFNVRAYAGQPTITTTLEEGSVKVYDDRMSVRMRPGDQVVYYCGNGDFSESVVNVADFNYWISGEIRFDQEPLKNILRRIGNCYGVKFQVAPTVDLKQKYTISFTSHEDIREVMTVLVTLSQNLKFNMSNNVIKLYAISKEDRP